jgi:ABC-2 type transport system permease protein
MNKLWLIIQREYLTRVTNKSFILITLLSPLILVGIVMLPVMLAVYTGKEYKRILVKDDSGIIDSLASSDNVTFTMRTEPLETMQATYKAEGYDGLLYLPAFKDLTKDLRVMYYSANQLSLTTKMVMESRVAEKVESYKIKAAGYNEDVMEGFKTKVSVEQKERALNEQGQWVETDKKNSANIATAIGFIAGFIIYIVLIFYGAMIMRSVMEEKTSRIVEVMISSVKPFQLMLGKIIGASAVGLTQMLVWIILTVVLLTAAQTFFHVDPAAVQDGMANLPQQQTNIPGAETSELLQTIGQQNWAYILPLLLFFFIGGYFIYASLFAALGSAMGDEMGESQSLSFIVMFPIIVSVILLQPVVENPNSPLAVWMSIIPLFSPVIMPARIAFEPPVWEVGLSMLLLVLGAVFFMWLSARIYRVGILMYGKKVTLKEIGKWMFYKD